MRGIDHTRRCLAAAAAAAGAVWTFVVRPARLGSRFCFDVVSGCFLVCASDRYTQFKSKHHVHEHTNGHRRWRVELQRSRQALGN